MSSTTILPCPYCGQSARVYLGATRQDRDYVGCEDLDCSVCGPFATGENEAIQKWNALPRTEQLPAKYFDVH